MLDMLIMKNPTRIINGKKFYPTGDIVFLDKKKTLFFLVKKRLYKGFKL